MNSEIVESFAQIARDKNIDKDVLSGIIREIFMGMIRKRYFTDENFSVIVNMDKGDIQIIQEVEVVEDVFSDVDEISLEDARKLDSDAQLGDITVKIIPLAEFGRRLIMQAKQSLNQKIRELEKDHIFNEYTAQIGEIVVGDVYQKGKSWMLVNHNKVELFMPKDEQILKENPKKGETIRAVIKDVKRLADFKEEEMRKKREDRNGRSNDRIRKENYNNDPVIIISRGDNKFLERLFEIEVPEIYDGIVQIRSIARSPGERAKIAVESTDDRVDAVGACVGMKGTRIHSIVKELSNENIDVVLYSSDPRVFISKALAPARVMKVEVDEKNKYAKVYVQTDQVKLAIGREGQNIKLASNLTGYEIDIIREFKPTGDDDVDIMEFTEFDQKFLQLLVDAGYDTARKVMQVSPDDIAAETGAPIDQINDLISEIEYEFREDDEN